MKKLSNNKIFTPEEISSIYDMFESFANLHTLEVNVQDLLANVKLMKLDKDNTIFYKILEATCDAFKNNNFVKFEDFISTFSSQIVQKILFEFDI